MTEIQVNQLISILIDEQKKMQSLNSPIEDLKRDNIFRILINEFFLFYTNFPQKQFKNLFDQKIQIYNSKLTDYITKTDTKEKIALQKAIPFVKEKDYKKAIHTLDNVKTHKSLAIIGFCYSEQNDYETALKYHLQSEKLEPENAWNLSQIGFCYQKQNDYETALKYHLQSEKLEPENAWNLSQIGFCYQKQNDYENALKYHLQSEKLEPENAWNLSQIGFCYLMQNDYETALKYHLQSEKLEPENAWNLSQIGFCYQKQNDYETAYEISFAIRKIRT
ncbi:MAG: tetratricopeptide repeat protein [Saprospiraceae bacterium]